MAAEKDANRAAGRANGGLDECSLDERALKLFGESLEQPDAERHEWLVKRCADSPELLERVLRLVEAEQLSDGFLEDTPASAPPSPA